ncbi:MAG: beta-ketoacyl synthase N-terminal-like domain-containing protein, partial [Candidatus Neomarinimicrobiota bacterium]
MKRRVVVTGLGIISPIGCSLSDYWKALENGTSGV